MYFNVWYFPKTEQKLYGSFWVDKDNELVNMSFINKIFLINFWWHFVSVDPCGDSPLTRWYLSAVCSSHFRNCQTSTCFTWTQDQPSQTGKSPRLNFQKATFYQISVLSISISHIGRDKVKCLEHKTSTLSRILDAVAYLQNDSQLLFRSLLGSSFFLFLKLERL